MESLDSLPKTMAFHVYAKTTAIACAATSTPVRHMKTKRLLSQGGKLQHERRAVSVMFL